MKRRKEESLSDVIGTFLHESGLATPLLQYRVLQEWSQCLPDRVAQHTQAIEIRSEILWVRADSPSLVSELTLQRAQICAELNRRVGANIVRDVRFVIS